MGTPAGGVASGYSLPDLSLLLMAPLAVAALGRRKKWQRWTWPLAGALLVVAVVSTGTALADTSVMATEVRQMAKVRVLVLSEAEGSNEEVEEQRSGLLLAPVPVVQPVGDSSPAPSPAPRVQSAGVVTTTRVISYTYDPLGRLVEADYSTGEQFQYAYDAVGNRTVHTATLDAATVTTYTYDAANRLTSAGGVTYTWDARGNLTSDGTFTYTYNSAGRMVWAESVTVTLVYTYNAQGLRVAQSVIGFGEPAGDMTSFAWDWASGLPEMLSEGGNLYLVGHDTLGQWDGADWAYYLPDALGSVRQATDDTGAVVSSQEWTPFGVEVGAGQVGPGYTGEWFDGNAGFLYLRARWYDLKTGRFTRRDPFTGLQTQPFSLNPYAYVLANPVSAVDPSGLYHSNVHYDLTRRLVVEEARALGISTYKYQVLANLIAEGNQNVDTSLVLEAISACRECHFSSWEQTKAHLFEAMSHNNAFLFGAALHQYQDYFSHWGEVYDEEGHGLDSITARAFPWNHLRSPGGKSNRTSNQLEDFFLGGHYIQVGPKMIWVESGTGAHYKWDVIVELRRRNPGIDLNGLNDNDLIDLYLRFFDLEPDWAKVGVLRVYFGIDPDAYIESSTRDTAMRRLSRLRIREFLENGMRGGCSVFGLTKPNDAKIKYHLTW
jgi:RHS repeat-associated protein